MKLKILGTGTATPSLERLSSSCLLTTTWGTLLIDAGPSVVRRLLEYGYTTHDVDLIVLTHFHPDHTVDLATFLFASNYGEAKREKPLTILGGSGLEEFFEKLLRVYPWLSPAGYHFTLKALPSGQWRLGKTTITTSASSHNPESIAVRVGDGSSSIVFTGDTDFSEELEALASRTDLLVSECSFPKRKVKGHLNLEDLQGMVERAHPRRVILTHLYPEWESFQGALPAPMLLGVDGLELEI